ncbi:hypothetical protein BDV18DRAFT_85754 [Aspergillus unguis]
MRSRSAARVKEYERMRGCSGQGGIDGERESSSSRWVFLTQILYSLRYWRFSVPLGGVPHLEATGSIPVAGATFIYPAGLCGKTGQWSTPTFSKGKVETIKRPYQARLKVRFQEAWNIIFELQSMYSK